MPRLVLVLRDLYPSRLSQAASAALPRLPALERWLAMGETELGVGGWRQWSQRELGGDRLAGAPLASIAAAAVAAVPADLPVWLATPVHFVAGLDSLRLHPAGLLELDPAEQSALAADFSRVFAGSGWSLHATGRRELLLAGSAGDAAVASHDPAAFLGADPGPGLPAGAAAAALRRLGSELELWLHEHPVNLARVRRGRLDANGLWLWGGGARVAAPVPAAPTPMAGASMAWADDLFVDGLARLTGALVQQPPARWPPAGPAGATVPDLVAVCELGATPDARSLQALERDWLAPALAQWQAGTYQGATLLAGARAVSLAGRSLRYGWRRLRRARPWWEILLQC